MKFKYSNLPQKVVILAQDMYQDEYGTIVSWLACYDGLTWQECVYQISNKDRYCQYKVRSNRSTDYPHIIYVNGSWWGYFDDHCLKTNKLYVEVER